MSRTPMKRATPQGETALPSADAAPAATDGDIDHDAAYRVTLNNAVRVGRRLVVGRNVKLKGRVLAAVIADKPGAVAGHERVET